MTSRFRLLALRIVAPAVFSFQLSVVLPWTVFFYNKSEFEISLTLLSYVTVIGFFICFAPLALISCSSKAISALVTGMSLIFTAYLLISNFFIPLQVGLLDGDDDVAGKAKLISDSLRCLLLLSAITIIYLFQREIVRDAVWFSSAATFALVLFIAFEARDFSKELEVPKNYSFNLSAKKTNVLIFSFDGLQGDIVANILDKNPSFKKSLKGFVSFTDTIAVAPFTGLSLPAMKTGFIPTDKKHRSIVEDLSRFGYEVLETPDKGFFFNSLPISSSTKTLLLAAQLRVLPQDLAERVSLNTLIDRIVGMHFKNSDKQRYSIESTNDPHPYALEKKNLYFNQLLFAIRSIENTNQNKTAYFYHNVFSHNPHILDRNCAQQLTSSVRQNYEATVNQHYCAVRTFTQLLAQLKNSDVFDNSLIVFTSDHGSGGHNGDPYFINESIYDPKYNAGSRWMVGRYHPVLMVKPINSVKSFVRSDAPACLIDIAPTVCHAVLDIEHCQSTRYDGINLLDSKLFTPNRERNFLLNLSTREDKKKQWDTRKRVDFDKISFTGNAKLAVYNSFVDGLKAIELDTPIDFSETFSNRILSLDLSHAEKKGRWTKREKVELLFKFSAVDQCKPCNIGIELRALVRKANPEVSASVLLNGKNIGEITFRHGKDNKEIVLFAVDGAEFRPDKTNVLQLDIEGAARPKDFSDSNDERLLGFHLMKFFIESS